MIQTFTTKLLYKKEVAPDIWYFRFELTPPKSLDFIPGQYLILRIGDMHRHFSIFSPNFDSSNFELLAQMIPNGLASTYLANLKIGDIAYFDGPAGVFTLKNTDSNKIFIATGTGIAPVRSILHTYLSSNVKAQMPNQIQNPNIYLFWGLRTYEYVYFFDELKELSEKNPNFKFKICLSKQEDFSKLDKMYFVQGRVNQHVFDFGQKAEVEYFISGDRLIVESLRQFVLDSGVSKEKVHFEKF